MADTKISALTAVTTPAATDEFAVNQAGTSKKVTLQQLMDYQAGTVPTIIMGAEFSGTGVPTATLPAGTQVNDILVLVLQGSNEVQPTPPTDYTRLGPQNGIGTAAAAGSTKMMVFWKRHDGSESAPTIPDLGEHTYGVMFAIRGCPTIGDPFRFIGNAWKFTASTTGTAAKGTTRRANSLIVNIFVHAIDNASAQGSSPTNSSLTSVTEQFDDGTTDGVGGGIYIMTGVKADPGEVAASTVTWAASTVDVSMTLAFIPATDDPTSARGPETQVWIGSNANLFDHWVKPYGARRVHVQTIDGGGSGSGGNTTTTAAGGGGGGGGGYDEAWFDADDLSATVQLKAGAGGLAGTALNQAGNAGTVSEFDVGAAGPLVSRRVAGTAATAAASADGGNGGCGSGRGGASPAVATTRIDLTAATAGAALGAVGGRGGSGTTAPTGGSPADWGGGGGESGGDTDAAITAGNNGWSTRGAGGGSSGRTNTNISQPGSGGGATSTFGAQGAAGADSTRLPYGGAGGVGGGSSVVVGGRGGFPGGGGGGGAGVAGGFGGAGGHGCVVITTFF